MLRIVREAGMEPVMWSVTGFDWSATSSQQIVTKVAGQVDGRGRKQSEIVLLHDGSHTAFGGDRHFTVEATRALLDRYSTQGKKFVSVAELIQKNAIPKEDSKDQSILSK